MCDIMHVRENIALRVAVRGEGGVAGEGRVVGVPKFHSWGKCTMPLTNINYLCLKRFQPPLWSKVALPMGNLLLMICSKQGVSSYACFNFIHLNWTLHSGNSPSSTECMSLIFVILKFNMFKIYSIWPHTNKQANIHTYMQNAVPLVWGLLRLTPIIPISSREYHWRWYGREWIVSSSTCI